MKKKKKGKRHDKNFDLGRVIVALSIVVLASLTLLVAYTIYKRTIGESESCRLVRAKKGISRVRYPVCRENRYLYGDRQKYDIIFDNPNSRYADTLVVGLDPITMEIVGEMRAI